MKMSKPILYHKRKGYWYYKLRGEKTFHTTGKRTKAEAEDSMSDYLVQKRIEEMALIELPEVQELVEKVTVLTEKIEAMEQYIQPQREWWDLKAACAWKGVSYNSVTSKRSLQPKNGYEDAIVSGRRMWRRKTVAEWIEEQETI